MKISITLLLLTLTLTSYAQESEKYQALKAKSKYKEGYVITTDSVKTKGLIKDFFSKARQYAEVSFVKLDGTQISYMPSELIGFGYSGHEFAANMAAFYKVIIAGENVSLYQSMTRSMDGANYSYGYGYGYDYSHTSNSTDLYFRKTGEKSFKWIRKKKFSEVFSTYFEDCAPLKSKIINGELGRGDIDAILDGYNNCQ
jgi:hypothetical protein